MEKSLPTWIRSIADAYESGAASQFILAGNIHDLQLAPDTVDDAKHITCGLGDFLHRTLLKPFDIVLAYDLGYGVRVEKGGDILSEWPAWKDAPGFPRIPREAMERLSHFLRYCTNLQSIGQRTIKAAVILNDANIILPNPGTGTHYDLGAAALLVREWSSDPALTRHPLATFLLTENLNDLHPLLSGNARAHHVEIPLPDRNLMFQALTRLRKNFSETLAAFESLEAPAAQLAGASLASVDSLLRRRRYLKNPLNNSDLANLKRELVEADCQGLISFLQPDRTLDDYVGQEGVKRWLRQDITLWSQANMDAMPKGYLVSGPVGTGKTFLVECLAGEAGVPVVKFGNFRDKWVGSTEGNLEKIFRLLHALGRCIVFIDEADQALGKRGGGSSDSGVSGRIYSMMAEEMSRRSNRGKILWVLATSRPDLVEVDLKRPGRIDVKIPIFPAAGAAACYALLRALAKRQDIVLPENLPADLVFPDMLTPGAAESLAVRLTRLIHADKLSTTDALVRVVANYRPAVSLAVIDAQIALAIAECSDASFIPEEFSDRSSWNL